MFERYTERARRVVFFARYEASQTGSMTIETEHFLLALMREDKNLMTRYLNVTADVIRDEVLQQITVHDKVATSVDLPLSNECRRILAYAAEEAERFNHRHIGTEHLLLGLLREERSLGAQILINRGMQLEAVREQMARSVQGHEYPEGVMQRLFPFPNNPNLPRNGVVPDEQTAKRIAEAVWIPVYGEDRVAAQAPLKVELKANIWIVSGSASDETALHAFIFKAHGAVLVIGEGQTPKSPI
jgi:ATP-dependent Clp protease ATP-binding subunit ClpA